MVLAVDPAACPTSDDGCRRSGRRRLGRRVLVRRIRWLVAATITYNIAEAAVAITACTHANSTALIGFGLDSIIEVASAAVVAWQFAGPDPAARERGALRGIAISFFALAGYSTKTEAGGSACPYRMPCSLRDGARQDARRRTQDGAPPFAGLDRQRRLFDDRQLPRAGCLRGPGVGLGCAGPIK